MVDLLTRISTTLWMKFIFKGLSEEGIISLIMFHYVMFEFIYNYRLLSNLILMVVFIYLLF